MEYWIDGYNLILRRGGAAGEDSLEQARDTVLRQVLSLRAPVRVYFDAGRMAPDLPAQAKTSGPVRAIFVRSGSADDAIVDDLRKRERAREVTVVTDDRELRLRIKQLRGQTLGIQKFTARLDQALAPIRRDQPLPKNDVDDWLDYFGIDEDWQP